MSGVIGVIVGGMIALLAGAALGWRGLDGSEKDYRCRLSNYMAYLQDELDRVFEDKDFTLKKYMDNVYEKYGVKCEYGA